MRVAVLFLTYAFAFEDSLAASPTDDPEEMDDLVLLDEYATAGEGAPRVLQEVINATNLTVPEPAPAQPINLLALGLVGLGGAGVAGFVMTQKGEVSGSYDYADVDDDGLLDDPEYQYSDYGEEYEEYE